MVLDNVKGIRSVMVVHHTDCGLTHITDDGIREKLRGRHPEQGAEAERAGPFGQIVE